MHEYVYAEFKRLNVIIDNLPYPVFIPPFFVQSPPQLKAQAIYPSVGGNVSPLQLHGGVPVDRMFDRNLSDLQKPVALDVAVPNLKPLLDNRGGLVRHAGSASRVALSDHNVADLIMGRPTVVKTTRGAHSFVRLIPAAAPSSQAPLQTRYQVPSVEAFVRSPYVTAADGSRLRVSLSGAQLQEFARTRSIAAKVGNSTIQVSAASTTAPVPAFVTRTGEALDSGDGVSVGVSAVAPFGSGLAVPPQVPSLGKLPLALYTPWKQLWKLKGYSRGELLQGIALAPQEEVTIEVSSWDRRKTTFEDSAQSEFEQSTDFTQTDKDSTSVVRDVGNQFQAGMTSGMQVGVKISEAVDIHGQATGNLSDALNTSAKTTLDTVSEAVHHSASKLRLERQTKVGLTTEIGTENKVTRKVKNANLCHSLRLNYYEILASYDIITQFNKDEAQLCILVPSDLVGMHGDFNYTNVRYYEDVLSRVLIVPALASGFAAAHTLFAQDELCEAKRRNSMCAAAAQVPSAVDQDLQNLIAQAGKVRDAYQTLSNASPSGAQLLPSAWAIFAPGLIWTIDISAVQKSFLQWLYFTRVQQMEPHLFDVISQWPSGTLTKDQVQDLIQALGVVTSLSQLGTQAISQDPNSLYGIIRGWTGLPDVVVFIVPGDDYAVDDAGFVASLSAFRDLANTLADDTRQQAAAAAMQANQSTVQADFPDKDIAQALESADALVQHLNAYKNYYRTMMLKLMPWSDQLSNLMSAYSPIVMHQVSGFTDEYVALPVNADLDPRLKQLFDTLVTNNKDLTSMQTVIPVDLPTPGIHLETRLGECSACEDYVEQIRQLDLESKRLDIRLKHEQLEQQKSETQRYRDRVQAKEYGDPVTRPTTVRLEEVQLSQAGPSPAPDGTTPPGG